MEYINTCIELLPLEAVKHTKEVQGDFATDPQNYYETYNLVNHGVYSFIGVNINGVFYCDPTSVMYSETSGKVTIRGLQLKDTDDVMFIYNTPTENNVILRPTVMPLTAIESAKIPHGDFESNPNEYYEEYDLTGIEIDSFIGLSVNSLLYCHPNKVEYDPNTHMLKIKRLSLTDRDKVCLVCNIDVE